MRGPSISSWAPWRAPDPAPAAAPPAVRVAVAPGPDPDRVLLVASGPLAGTGAVPHQEAVTGALARLLAEHSGRGAVVESVGRDDLRLVDVARLLTAGRLEHFDAIVLGTGTAEAIAGTSRRTWTRTLSTVLETAHARQPRDGTVLVAGVPSASGARAVARRARLLDRSTRATVAARPFGHFVRLESPASADGPPTAATCTDWASQICTVLEPLLSRSAAASTGGPAAGGPH